MSIVAIVGTFALYILAIAFCHLFWMEDVGRFLDQTMAKGLALNIVRVGVLLGLALIVGGLIRTALLRYQEKVS